jgi:hypothetical protein
LRSTLAEIGGGAAVEKKEEWHFNLPAVVHYRLAFFFYVQEVAASSMQLPASPHWNSLF